MSLSNTLLTVEGIEGVGKSTALQFIKEYLTQKNQSFILTREPGGTLIAEKIRSLLLTLTPEETMQPETELLLLFAARVQHVHNVILPALKTKKWVICDRFLDASFAYQGGGRGIASHHIQQLAEWLLKDLHPIRTILLDAPPELGLMRAKNRGPKDRIESETLSFHERVRAGYLERARQDKKRFRMIDASQSLEQVNQDLKKVMDELF